MINYFLFIFYSYFILFYSFFILRVKEFVYHVRLLHKYKRENNFDPFQTNQIRLFSMLIRALFLF